MSMSTHVLGFKPPDDKYNEMKAIWDACEVAGVEIPDEVSAFFDDEEPDPTGVVVVIPCKVWSTPGSNGFEVLVDEIPKDVKVLRFFQSW